MRTNGPFRKALDGYNFFRWEEEEEGFYIHTCLYIPVYDGGGCQQASPLSPPTLLRSRCEQFSRAVSTPLRGSKEEEDQECTSRWPSKEEEEEDEEGRRPPEDEHESRLGGMESKVKKSITGRKRGRGKSVKRRSTMRRRRNNDQTGTVSRKRERGEGRRIFSTSPAPFAELPRECVRMAYISSRLARLSVPSPSKPPKGFHDWLVQSFVYLISRKIDYSFVIISATCAGS